MLHHSLTLSKTLPVAALAVVLITGTPVFAEEEPTYSLSANVSLVSDYRFRGISLSDKDIALQGGIDLETTSGFYLGTWASSIDSYASSELELDIYGGYAGAIGDIAYDVGFLAYLYPGSTGDTTYYEPYASISGAVDKLEWTFGAAYAFDQDNLGGQDNIYVYLDGAYPLRDDIAVTGHVAYENGAFGDDKWDWSVGASYAFDKFSVGLSYVDTNLGKGLGGAGVVVSLGAAF